MSNEYLVAKYIASPTRMEPRNVGIFMRIGNVWRARFLGESAAGKLDLRRVRSVVESTSAYQQWIGYWRHLLSSTAPDNLRKALEESSKANFMIGEGAPLFLGPDAPESPDKTLEYLYHLIVTEFPEQIAEESTLAEIVKETIERFHLNENPHFYDSPRVACTLPGGVIEHVRPSYGFVNGREIYFQTVSINPNRPEMAQKEVHNAAWIFDRLRADQGRELNSLIKVISADGPQDPTIFSVDESLDVLNALSHVVDVEDQASIEAVFEPLAV